MRRPREGPLVQARERVGLAGGHGRSRAAHGALGDHAHVLTTNAREIRSRPMQRCASGCGPQALAADQDGRPDLHRRVLSKRCRKGIRFAERAGLDVNAVVETISKGAAQSWQMDNRHKTINNGKFDFRFAVNGRGKDSRFASPKRGATAPACQSRPLPMRSIRKSGDGRKRFNTSSLLGRLKRENHKGTERVMVSSIGAKVT